MVPVTLSAPQARLAWRSTFKVFIDVRGSLATNWVGLAPLHFTWQAWHFHGRRRHFEHLRLDLRGRRGTYRIFIDVRGSLATNWVGLAPLHFTWQAWRFQHLRLSSVAGVALSAPQARFAWQA